MKKLTLLAIITIFALSLISCGSNHYSPLDNYINTEVKRAEANAKHLAESQKFIDITNSMYNFSSVHTGDDSTDPALLKAQKDKAFIDSILSK